MKPTDPDHINIIYPYYSNPQMLERQVENWERWSGALGKRCTFILVDDCSPEPAKPIFEKLRHKKKLFRVKENIPWAQHHARNIGAFEAEGDNPWLFISDMDIILTPEALNDWLDTNPDPARTHTFERHFIGNIREPKMHCNTFMVKKKNYWAVNGYDVDYCGGYGGDMEFMRQLYTVAPPLHHGKMSKHLVGQHVECTNNDIILWGYEPQIIQDANTREWGRKKTEWQKRYLDIRNKKHASGDLRSKNPIRWGYERIL